MSCKPNLDMEFKNMGKKLSQDQLRAVNARRRGESKMAAYKMCLMTDRERNTVKERTIKGRALRFFALPEVKAALDMSDEEFDDIYLKSVGKPSKSQERMLKDAVDKLHALNVAKAITESTNAVLKETAEVEKAVAQQVELSADQAFFESLQISKERPDEIILTGTARFILKRAISEINARAKEIRDKRINPLHKDASAFTATNLKAVQIGVSILENRTERYLSAMQNNDSIALELLNRSIESIEIRVDDYTAPIPATALAAQKKDEKESAQDVAVAALEEAVNDK